LAPHPVRKKLPSDEKDGEQRALDNRADSASDAIPFFAKISLQGPFFYVICGILVVLLLIMFGMISRRSDTSPTPTSNPTSQTPTLLPTTRTAVSDIPTPTKPAEIFPDLNIVELVHNIETIPKGRDHAELTTRLSLELNGLQDADAIIELQTVLPPRLTLIPGAGFPSPEQDVLEAPVIQRIALANVDPQDIVFSTKYIVEWPHVTHPTFELTVTAKLLGANKTVLAQVEESTLPFEIDHIPELRVDQAVIPDLVTKNDPATLQLAIHNTGATYIDRLEINWGASQIDEPFSNADLWQNKLDNIVLEPGEVMTVSISTPVITNHPRSLSAWLAIKGALDDGSSVTSDGEPAHWAIYANGKVVLQDGCIDCYLRTALGSEEKVSDLDNGVLLKVLDAKKGPDENSVWYQVEYTLSNEQPTMGWVKSEYVQLPPDIEAYLQERADE